MADLTNIVPIHAQKIIDRPEQQLLDSIVAAGLSPPDKAIELDGRIHRFSTNGKRGDTSGWYIGYSDGVPSGRFGCWRSGLDVLWRAETGRTMSAADEMEYRRRVDAARIERDAALEQYRSSVAGVVRAIWDGAALASADHPYLARKGIQPHGTRVTGDGRLVVPLYGADGELSTLQYIDADGEKPYHLGGQASGKFWSIGTFDAGGIVYIAEGFATAATIHETTTRPCIVAFSASNIVPVTAIIKQSYSDIMIVADNDASGVGQRYAEQACAKYGAKMVVIPESGMDANDYAKAGHNLAELLTPSASILDHMLAVFGDELSDEYHAPDELVEGLITIGGTSILYGDSNSGKTFFALSIAAAIAEGVECYGRQTDQGVVVYLATESPASVKSRVQALKKYHRYTLSNLVIVQMPVNFYTGDGDANNVIELVREVEKIKQARVRLIIGDTLARMSAGANENSGEDMAPIMARFDRIVKATKSGLLAIHHNGKDQAKGARGWSGIRAHIDTEIEVFEREGVRGATVTKQRELNSKGDTISFKLEVVEMGVSKFGKLATTCVAVPDSDGAATLKKPTKHDENMRIFERAWWKGGAKVVNGSPYVSRQAFKNLLINDGLSERTAQNATEPQRKNGIISILLNAGLIESNGAGWIVINESQASAMLIQK